MIKVKKIHFYHDDFQVAKQIRYEVFVLGQHVPKSDEFDEFETSSHHFLAFVNTNPVGTARWRITTKGAKLERFAVIKQARGQGVGHSLLQAVLNDIADSGFRGTVYLHSQVGAISLYANFGFCEVGELFDECGIIHRAMEKKI